MLVSVEGWGADRCAGPWQVVCVAPGLLCCFSLPLSQMQCHRIVNAPLSRPPLPPAPHHSSQRWVGMSSKGTKRSWSLREGLAVAIQLLPPFFFSTKSQLPATMWDWGQWPLTAGAGGEISGRHSWRQAKCISQGSPEKKNQQVCVYRDRQWQRERAKETLKIWLRRL